MAIGVFARRLSGALGLGLAEAASALGLVAALTAPASAQNRPFDDRFPFLEERARRGAPAGGGGGGGIAVFFSSPNERPAAPVVENNTKAPQPARKTDAMPLTSVVV